MCCIVDDYFDFVNHALACRGVDDEHSVPYECDGAKKKICCTESNIVAPQLGRWGQCRRVDGDPDGLVSHHL